MQSYPKIIKDEVVSVAEAMRQISRLREEDITDRNRFNSIFINGRKVNRIPTSSLDILTTDKVGDFNATDSFVYYCVLSAGVATWVRVGMATW